MTVGDPVPEMANPGGDSPRVSKVSRETSSQGGSTSFGKDQVRMKTELGGKPALLLHPAFGSADVRVSKRVRYHCRASCQFAALPL